MNNFLISFLIHACMEKSNLRCSKLLLSSFVLHVSHCPSVLLGVRHIGDFVYLSVEATIGVSR